MSVLRALWAVARGVWLALDGLRKVLHLLVLLAFFGALLAVTQSELPFVPDRAALVLAPEGYLVEELSGDPLERALSRAAGDDRAETRLRDLIDVIDAARDDERIKALVLDLEGLEGAGLPMLQDIARSIRWFRESGKKVFAYGEAFSQRQYFLAAQADEVYLDPMGYVLLEGYAYYRTYFRGTLDKLGVDVNVFKAGRHKSAPDEWTRTDMSAEDREDARVWVGALWEGYKDDVAKARDIAPAMIQAYADEASAGVAATRGNLARYAEVRGLVDGLKTRREFEDIVAAVAGKSEDDHGFESVDWRGYLPYVRSDVSERRHDKAVGVIVASGEILDGEHSSGLIGGDSLSQVLRDARENDDLAAVVLRIDSPGGSIMASEVIRREVAALSASGKPVVASMGTVAASGGYYIAMDADRIVAAPTTITGSIGVFAVIPTFQRTLAKVGVTNDGFGTTVLAGQTEVDRELGAEARQILQASVEHAYRTFVGHVARSRKRPAAEVENVAQGRVWLGADARAAGIVDELGGVDEAVAEAARLAGLKEDAYDVEWLEQDVTWRDAIELRFRRAAAALVDAVTPRRAHLPHMSAALARAKALIALAAEGRPVYFCGCRIE